MTPHRFDQFLEPENPKLPQQRLFLYRGMVSIVLFAIITIIVIAFLPDRTQTGETLEATSPGVITDTFEAIFPATTAHSPTPSFIPTDKATTTTPTNTHSPTTAPSMTPTVTAVPTPLSTSNPNLIRATCICEFGNIPLFIVPDPSSQQVGVDVEVGDIVVVLGRATTGSWIYVEFDGEKGWVDARQFEISVLFEQLEVAETPFPTWTPTTNSPGLTSTTNPPDSTVFAYWQVTSSSSTGDGRWKTILALRVPRGGSYAFSFADLTVTSQFMRQVENGFDLYDVTISSISCVGDLVGDLIVKRNGQQLTVRNEHTDQSGAVFVSAPDC